MKNRTPAVLVICVTIVACTALVGVVTLLLSGRADASTLTILVGLSGSLLGTVAGLARTEQVKTTVDDLSNGLMDAKIRAAVADVVADNFIDPNIGEQLHADRARRGDH